MKANENAGVRMIEIKKSAIIEVSNFDIVNGVISPVGRREIKVEKGDTLYIENSSDSIENYIEDQHCDVELPAFAVYLNEYEGEEYFDSTPYVTEEQRDKAKQRFIEEIERGEAYVSI